MWTLQPTAASNQSQAKNAAGSNCQKEQSSCVEAAACFRSTAENSPDLVRVLTPDMTVLYVNPAVKDILGYTPEEMINLTVIKLVHPLGLSVVAEGVETPQQLECLRAHDCDFAQGYYFSHPLSLGQFETWLTRH